MPTEAEAHREASQHATEYLILVAKFPISRIGEGDCVVVAGIDSTSPGPGRGQQDQLLGMLYRKQAQQRLVEQTEDRRVRADAQPKREQSNQNEHRAFAKAS